MYLLKHFSLAWLFLSFAYVPAYAQATENTRLATYVVGEEVKKSLGEVAVRWDRLLGNNCLGNYVIEFKSDNIFIVSAISMSEADQYPTGGIWTYKFSASRCGEKIYFNVVFVGEKTLPPKIMALIPGETMASPQLIFDALSQLKISIQAFTKAQQGKKCDDFAIMDSKVTIPSKIGGTQSQFEEVWSYRYCDSVKPITMCFSPNHATGGTSFRTEACKDIENRSK